MYGLLSGLSYMVCHIWPVRCPCKSADTRLKQSAQLLSEVLLCVWCSEYMDDLKAYRDECGSVLSEVSQALSFLSELKCKYVNVSMKTNALHEACENLLEEQVGATDRWLQYTGDSTCSAL